MINIEIEPEKPIMTSKPTKHKIITLEENYSQTRKYQIGRLDLLSGLNKESNFSKYQTTDQTEANNKLKPTMVKVAQKTVDTPINSSFNSTQNEDEQQTVVESFNAKMKKPTIMKNNYMQKKSSRDNHEKLIISSLEMQIATTEATPEQTMIIKTKPKDNNHTYRHANSVKSADKDMLKKKKFELVDTKGTSRVSNLHNGKKK